MQSRWKDALIVLINKKGDDKLDCGCYRGVLLLDMSFKIMAVTAKKNRFIAIAEEHICEYQCIFRSNIVK